jgi:serine/threonine protein kinase
MLGSSLVSNRVLRVQHASVVMNQSREIVLWPRSVLGENSKSVVLSCGAVSPSSSAVVLKVAKNGDTAPGVTATLSLSHEYDTLIRLKGIPGVPVAVCFGFVGERPVLLTEGVGVSAREVYRDALANLAKGAVNVLTLEQIYHIAEPIVITLQQVHARGILHRDICPSNIVFMCGRWHLIDFGSAGSIGAADIDQDTQCRQFVVQSQYASRRLLHTSAPLDEEDDFEALARTLTSLVIGKPDAMDSKEEHVLAVVEEVHNMIARLRVQGTEVSVPRKQHLYVIAIGMSVLCMMEVFRRWCAR